MRRNEEGEIKSKVCKLSGKGYKDGLGASSMSPCKTRGNEKFEAPERARQHEVENARMTSAHLCVVLSTYFNVAAACANVSFRDEITIR